MSGRRSHRQDSLELLLDTICNTFGGVLFIAILVVLLLQQTGRGPSSEMPESPPTSAVDLQQMTIRMESLTEELSRQHQNRDSQDILVQSLAPEAVRQLLAERRTVTDRQDSLQSAVDQQLIEITALATRVETLAEENAQVRPRLEKAKTNQRVVADELQEERASRQEVAHLPTLRSVHTDLEVGFTIRYGRLYLWHEYEGGQFRLGLNTKDYVILAEESGDLIVHPNPLRGIPLDDSEASREAVRNVLRQFDAKTCHLAIIARPDSHGVFRYVRDRAVELGFDYRLMPVASDEPIADRGGRARHVQ